MSTRSALLAAAALCAFAAGKQARSAEKFQKLSGAQIQARIAGMEITDETHWADVFAANGTLTSYSMGRKSNGKWRVQKDELCIDRGSDDSGCYQVWLAGKKVELRREGSTLPREGVLQRRSARQ
jgi:hypothetical protein